MRFSCLLLLLLLPSTVSALYDHCATLAVYDQDCTLEHPVEVIKFVTSSEPGSGCIPLDGYSVKNQFCGDDFFQQDVYMGKGCEVGKSFQRQIYKADGCMYGIKFGGCVAGPCEAAEDEE